MDENECFVVGRHRFFSWSEQRSARSQLANALPNSNRSKFFGHKCVSTLYRAKDSNCKEIFDRTIIGFGAQGLHHLDAILRAWSSSDSWSGLIPARRLAVVGDCRGSDVWNDTSLAFSQNSPPENRNRLDKVNEFIEENHEILTNYMKSIGNTASMMILDQSLNLSEEGIQAQNAPLLRGVYGALIEDLLYKSIVECLDILEDSVQITFMQAMVKDILADRPQKTAEELVVRFTLDNSEQLVSSKKIYLDTGIPTRHLRAPDLTSECLSLTAIRALSRRTFSNYMDERLEHHLNRLHLLEKRDASLKKGAKIGIRGKRLSAYETFMALNKFMRVFDYDMEKKKISVDLERAKMYRGSIHVFSRGRSNKEVVNKCAWRPPRTFAYLPLVNEQTGATLANTDPFFWPYPECAPRNASGLALLSECVHSHGHALLTDLAEEAKLAVHEAVLFRSKEANADSQSKDIKSFCNTINQVMKIRGAAKETPCINQAAALRKLSNHLVLNTVYLQQSLERATAYPSMLVTPPLTDQGQPLNQKEWGHQYLLETQKLELNLAQDLLQGYQQNSALVTRITTPLGPNIANRTQYCRLMDPNAEYLTAATPAVVMILTLAIELGIVVDVESSTGCPLRAINIKNDKYKWALNEPGKETTLLETVLVMPTFDALGGNGLHRRIVKRCANRNEKFKNLPPRPLIDHCTRLMVDKRGRLANIQDNTLMNWHVSSCSEQLVVGDREWGINNLDSVRHRADTVANYVEPIDTLIEQIFPFLNHLEKIEILREISKATLMPDHVFRREIRILEPHYFISKAKDLALGHCREIRKRSKCIDAWQKFRQRVSAINDPKKGGLAAISMLVQDDKDGLGPTEQQLIYRFRNQSLNLKDRNLNFGFNPPRNAEEQLKLMGQPSEAHLGRQLIFLRRLYSSVRMDMEQKFVMEEFRRLKQGFWHENQSYASGIDQK